MFSVYTAQVYYVPLFLAALIGWLARNEESMPLTYLALGSVVGGFGLWLWWLGHFPKMLFWDIIWFIVMAVILVVVAMFTAAITEHRGGKPALGRR